MSADAMNPANRAFYERAKLKFAFSVFLGSIAVVSLALGSICAGLSDSTRIESKNVGGSAEDALVSQSAGYGFAAFLFVVTFLVLLCGAVLISPLFCGSANERASLLPGNPAPVPDVDNTTLPSASAV